MTDQPSFPSRVKQRLVFLAWTLAVLILLNIVMFILLLGGVETTPFRYVGF